MATEPRLEEQITRLLSDLGEIAGKPGQLELPGILKALVSVLKDERAGKLASKNEWRELVADPRTKGERLKQLAEGRTARPWTTAEVQELMELLEILYGVYDRQPIGIADKLSLLTKEYVCNWGPDDEPFGEC